MRTAPVLRLAVLAVLLGGLCALGAETAPPPTRDALLFDRIPVVVDYQASASAEHLMLPFHAEAAVGKSFRYRITTRDGKPVLLYAFALLTTDDSPSAVADSYSAALAGHPKPELIEDEQGKRIVLSVGNATEVRTVSIFEHGRGSRIQLIRATTPLPPSPPTRSPRTPRGRSRAAA